MTTVNRSSGTYNRLRTETKELLDSSPVNRGDFGYRLNKILIDWIRNGGTLEEFYTEFEKCTLRASYPTKIGRCEPAIRMAYNSAAEFLDEGSDPVALREKLIELRRRVATSDLYGERSYLSPRQTWLVMLHILIEDMQSNWNRGYRRLAIEAGLGSPETARNHVLVAMSDEIDLIRDQTPELSPEEIERGVPKPASRLAFNLDWMEGELLTFPIQEKGKQGEKLDNIFTNYPKSVLSNNSLCFSPDAWAHCLGANRKPAYEALTTEPAKVSEIVAVTGLSSKTVRDHLDYLVGKGVVCKEPARKGRGYEYRIDPTPDTEQIEVEAAYWKAESEQKFEKQRTDFNAYSTV